MDSETQDKKAQSSTSQIAWIAKKHQNKSAIERLFDKLDMLYPGKWRQQFKSPQDASNWAECWGEELEERGITYDEAKKGLDRCIKLYKDWPPTFPQFLEACRPSIDYEAAFHEANQQMHLRSEGSDTWSNPAIYWAAVSLGGDLNNPYISVKSRWKSALDKAIDDVKSGRLDSIVPKRPKLLDAPKRQGKEYSEVAKRELAKCYEILNTEPKWRKELREKGKDVSTPAVGLKPLSDYVSVNREAVEA